MNLQITLDDRLANAIASAYDSKNYSGAVIDAIHLLGDLIRSKSGLDFDGNQLIGSALGGQNPLIKVNSLQTESERDEQKGIEHLLRGHYIGIRNPRSHAKRDDNIEIANALITFVDCLIRAIERGRSSYDVPSIISQVFDALCPHKEVRRAFGQRDTSPEAFRCAYAGLPAPPGRRGRAMSLSSATHFYQD